MRRVSRVGHEIEGVGGEIRAVVCLVRGEINSFERQAVEESQRGIGRDMGPVKPGG
jgi:hypothetical protein